MEVGEYRSLSSLLWVYYEIWCSGHVSVADRDVFTKFCIWAKYPVPNTAKWLKCTFGQLQDGRQRPNLKWRNRNNLHVDIAANFIRFCLNSMCGYILSPRPWVWGGAASVLLMKTATESRNMPSLATISAV